MSNPITYTNISDRLKEIIKELNAENAALKEEIEEWRYQLAYYSDEEADGESPIPTPKGVKAFIESICWQRDDLKMLVDTTIDTKNKEIAELKKEIKDRADTEQSLTEWVDKLGDENDELKAKLVRVEEDEIVKLIKKYYFYGSSIEMCAKAIVSYIKGEE